jgi:hypothetical protein
MSDDEDRVMLFTCINEAGESKRRWITPISIRWGTTERHPRPCWLLLAHDHENGTDGEFSLEDCRFEPVARL